VLVDGATQSGGETLAQALQYYHRAVIVGSRTAGKVLGVDAEERLEDGGLLRVATLDIIAPGGLRLERKGVLPDVIVNPGGAQMRTALALSQR
jgi:carboxyl-terminal processing protease